MSCYVISVSAGTGCYRHIQISKDATLYMLHKAIIKAFDFDDDHAHAFFMDNKYWSKGEPYFSKEIDAGTPDTKSRTLGKLGLEKGRQFKYLFDLGAEWRFQCKVLRENDDYLTVPFVVRSVGESPAQYPEDAWEKEVEEALQQQIEELYEILDLPEKTIENVRRYFIAAARLYGAIPMFKLMDIYNSQNAPIYPEEFMILATIFNTEGHFFGVIGPEDFDEDAEPDPEQWYVAADYLLEDEAYGFFVLVEMQGDKPYKVLPKVEFLKYTDEDYYPLTPQSLAMRNYLRSRGDLRWPDDVWLGIQTMMEIDFTVQQALGELKTQGLKFRDIEDAQKFMDLFQDLNNHTRKHINCGHTPMELFELNRMRVVNGGKKRSNKPTSPSLNGPCPCGSGKKYKRCCGKTRK